MAFTYTKIQETVLGNLRCWVGTLTFDSSYPTGGLAYTNASFGFANKPVFIGFDSSASGYDFQHDRTNGKIIAYLTAGFTPAGTNSAPTISVSGGVGGTVAIGIGSDADAAALSKTAATSRTGITGVQAPTFTGTAVAAAAASEVANLTSLTTLVVNVFVLGI